MFLSPNCALPSDEKASIGEEVMGRARPMAGQPPTGWAAHPMAGHWTMDERDGDHGWFHFNETKTEFLALVRVIVCCRFLFDI